MKTMLIGADGQLGSDIVKIFAHDSFYDLIPLTRPEIDITKPNLISAAIDRYHPEMILSTAAYHKVDECEIHVDESFEVNAFGVRNLALACQKHDLTLIHFSTDYVFGQDQKRATPYTEADLPGPLNVYGISKLTGEYFIKSTLKKYFIIRTCGLYGSAGPASKQENFVDSIVKKAIVGQEIAVVNDQIATPSYTFDLANNLKELLKTTEFGLYHITSEGQCSWYEFAAEILKDIKEETKIIPISSAKFYLSINRPAYSVLDNTHLKQIGLNLMKPWQDALKRYIQEKEYRSDLI